MECVLFYLLGEMFCSLPFKYYANLVMYLRNTKNTFNLKLTIKITFTIYLSHAPRNNVRRPFPFSLFVIDWTALVFIK